MPIPDFQSIMLPLLQFAGDKQEHTLKEAILSLAEQFGLSANERKELLPSGGQAVFDNRVGWARTYMKKAGLLDSPRRGRFCITERGIKVLEQNPLFIDVAFLKQFPEFNEFLSTKMTDRKETTEDRSGSATPEDLSPEELFQYSYQQLRSDLANELLEKIKSCSPEFFENLVVELLVKMGYGGSLKDAGQAVGKSGDGGIDGIIKEDRLGLDFIYIQAKRWDGVVGRSEIQKFVGALQGKFANKGVFITTSRYTREAREYVQSIQSKIVLIDGEELANLMIDYDLGVSKVQTYDIKKIDSDYFVED